MFIKLASYRPAWWGVCGSAIASPVGPTSLEGMFAQLVYLQCRTAAVPLVVLRLTYGCMEWRLDRSRKLVVVVRGDERLIINYADETQAIQGYR
jgi:hypothetical protein